MTQIANTLQIVPAVASVFYSDSKFGAMKNGDKKPYLILELLTGGQKEIHPRKVAQLLTGKEVDGFKVVESQPEVAEITEVVAAAETDQNTVEPDITETVVSDTKPAEQTAEKALSKKARAIAIYKEVHAANGARKDAMTRFKTELGMSDAGANTYYQNIKSGMWK